MPRTIALEVCLREGAGSIGERAGALFAAPDRPLDLHRSFAPPAEPPLSPDRAIADAADPRARPETIASDLGRLLDDREPLFETPAAPAGQLAAGLCQALGLDPDRLDWRDGAWMVKGDPGDPHAVFDTPLKTWRPIASSAGSTLDPKFGPQLGPRATRVNGARLE